MRVFLVCLLALAATAAATSKYTTTPFGEARSECVHEVPNHSELIDTIDGTLVVPPVDSGVGPYLIPMCNTTELPLLKPRARAHNIKQPTVPGPFVYDGWQAYTTYQLDQGFNVFTGNFTTPTTDPEETPEQLYLFTGLQNVDWIPIVDPEPSVFDIIQPVIQYPAASGKGWSVRSWYVTLGASVLMSPQAECDEGDVVFGNMTKTGDDTWYIGSTNVRTGKTVSVKPTSQRLAVQPWAYVTLEMYGGNSCKTFPTTPSYFTDMILTATNGSDIDADWTISYSPTALCSETNIAVTDSATVTVNFT